MNGAADAKLAIHGGSPVRPESLPYGHQVIEEDDIQNVVDALRGFFLTTGPLVSEYERAFAKKVGARHAVALNSGTAALHAAVFAAGVGPGDEVITTPITFVASSNCILYCGGVPVFADVEADTLNIDPLRIKEKLSDRTKAIIPVDFAGQPAAMEEVTSIANEHDLVIIEDAAHSLGASYKGSPVGSLSTMTIFSTHPVKHITTGEGGMVVTDNDEYAHRLRVFRTHGISVDANERERAGDWFYEMKDLGFNYRIPDILCALGISQLGKLERFVERRREIASRYDEFFSRINEIEPLRQRPDRESSFHLYVIRLKEELLTVGRKEVFKALKAEGIGVNVHYIPLYWHPYYQSLGYTRGLCPVAESQYRKIISLPLWAGMSDKDVEDVICAVEKVVRAYRK